VNVSILAAAVKFIECKNVVTAKFYIRRGVVVASNS
jgi:hypothetical protein